MNESELELIRDYLDERIDAGGLERLNGLLESDPEARAEFRSMANLEEGLRDLSVESEMTFPTDLSAAGTKAQTDRRRNCYQLEHFGLSASLMLCLGLAVLLWQSRDREDTWGGALAKIEFLSEDAGFGPGHQLPTTEGSLLGKGWVQLEEGRIRLLFRSGATVEAEGPAALGIDTSMRAYLDFGNAKVYTPETARDFVIATESMEVVDLGTRFEIGVDPQSGESKVNVTEGLVDLHLGSPGANRRIRPLEAGFAARVNSQGRIVEITNGGKKERIAPHLLAHWAFDQGDADGIVTDSAPNKLEGLLSGDTPPQPVSGISGTALKFDERGFVDLSEHVPTLAQLNDYTYSAWVRDPGPRLSMLFSLSGDSEEHRVQIYLSRRFVYLGWQNGLHYDSLSGRVEAWETGRWHHVAVAVQEGVARLYRDGTLLASGTMGAKIGTPVLTPARVDKPSHAYFGRLEDGRQGEKSAPQWFEGKLDDVQIYSGALSEEAIRFIFEHPGQVWEAGETPIENAQEG